MRALCAIVLVAGLLSLPSSGSAAEQVRLSIYVGQELDFCPNGYVNAPRCPPFNALRFEELLISDRIKLHDTMIVPLASVRIFEQGIVVPLNGVLRSLARRARAMPQTNPARNLAVLLVAEWADSKEEQSQIPLQYNAEGKIVDDVITGAIPNRRSFNHGSLKSIDPEERYPWTFVRGASRVTLFFR